MARAMPKSMTLTWPVRVSMTFAGLMSRWTMPLRCEYSSAWRMPMRHLQGALGQQLAAGVQQLAEGGAVHVLHHDVRDRDPVDVVLAGVVDGDDRGVVERGGRLGLAAEPGLEGRVAGEVGAQRLHRDGAAEPGVMGEVDLGHATAAEHRAQLVPAAEATRLFHSSPALSVRPDPHLVCGPAVCCSGIRYPARSCERS